MCECSVLSRCSITSLLTIFCVAALFWIFSQHATSNKSKAKDLR